MEKIKLTHEQIANHELEVVQFMDKIPWDDMEQMAYELAADAVILAEDGVAYVSPREIVHYVYYYLKYYSNFDVTDYNTPDGRVFLFDYFSDLVCPRIEDIDTNFFYLYKRICSAMTRIYEHENTSLYRLIRMLDNEELISTLDASKKAADVLIDLTSQAKELADYKTGTGDLSVFAKKTL